MTGELEEAFNQHYRGRHDPVDALWWLQHPDRQGPTGAPPVQQLFLEAADELEQTHSPEAAAALLESLADLLQADRQQTLAALRRANGRLEETTRRPCTN